MDGGEKHLMSSKPIWISHPGFFKPPVAILGLSRLSIPQRPGGSWNLLSTATVP